MERRAIQGRKEVSECRREKGRHMMKVRKEGYCDKEIGERNRKETKGGDRKKEGQR